MQLFRDPAQGFLDEGAAVVRLDIRAPLRQEGAERGEVFRHHVPFVTLQVGPELEDAPLGAEQDLLGHRRRLDSPRRVTQKPLEQFRLRQPGLALHVAGGKAVHGVGDGDQGEGAHLVADGGQIGRFLRVAAEQHRVPGRQQGVYVVVPGHHVQGVLGDRAGGDLEHETADLLAHGHIVGLQPVEDALAGGGVRDIAAADQGRAHGAALGRMLAFRLEEEGVLAPDIATALGAIGLEQLGDLRGRRDGIADHATADMSHDVGDGPVAVDDGFDARKFDSFPLFPTVLVIHVGADPGRHFFLLPRQDLGLDLIHGFTPLPPSVACYLSLRDW